MRTRGSWRRPDGFVHDGRVLGADVDWAAVPWPAKTYDRGRVLQALRAVVEPRRRDWSDPITMIVYAVGNGHRGTVYPAALAMVGQLLIVAEHYPGSPRRTALQILAQWWGGYQAERGFESYLDGDGARVALIPAMARRIADGLGRIDDSSTKELLTVVPLGWGHEVDDDGTVQHWGGRLDADGSVHWPAGP